jgi:hypothetical protein
MTKQGVARARFAVLDGFKPVIAMKWRPANLPDAQNANAPGFLAYPHRSIEHRQRSPPSLATTALAIAYPARHASGVDDE